MPDNPYQLKAPPRKAGARSLIIPDIHGCRDTFQALVESLALKKKDQLFLLGDYVNKGPDSSGTLEYIFLLQDKGYQLYCLRGNHEQEWLNREGDPAALRSYAQLQNAGDLLKNNKKIKGRYRRFFHSLPYYCLLEKVVLVHAGLDFYADKPFEDTRSMLCLREFPYKKKPVSGRRIVHGHHPHPISTIRKAIKKQSSIIPLDNGCVYTGRGDQQGNLLCLNANSFELTVQPNLEVVGVSG